MLKFGQKGTASTVVIIAIPVWLLAALGCKSATDFVTFTILLWGLVISFAWRSYKAMLRNIEQSKRNGGHFPKDLRGK